MDATRAAPNYELIAIENLCAAAQAGDVGNGGTGKGVWVADRVVGRAEAG